MLLQKVAGEMVISEPKTGEYYTLNPIGGLAQFTKPFLSAKTKGFLISTKGDALDGACLLANIAVKKRKLVANKQDFIP